mgnify:FL=1
MVTLSIAVAFLFISTVTFLPFAESKPVMNKINVIEEKIQVWSDPDQKNGLIQNVKIDGIIEWLIQLIKTIILLVFKLIEVVQNLINLVNLIQNLINALQVLFQLIQQLIELIQDILPTNNGYTILKIKNHITN